MKYAVTYRYIAKVKLGDVEANSLAEAMDKAYKLVENCPVEKTPQYHTPYDYSVEGENGDFDVEDLYA